MSVSMENCEGEVALEGEGESSRDSELPLTFIHSITVVPVAVLEPDRDLEKKKKETRIQFLSSLYLTNLENTKEPIKQITRQVARSKLHQANKLLT